MPKRIFFPTCPANYTNQRWHPTRSPSQKLRSPLPFSAQTLPLFPATRSLPSTPSSTRPCRTAVRQTSRFDPLSCVIAAAKSAKSSKSWLLEHVASSANRVGVWGKYLVALSGSLERQEGSKTSAKRKRLHILYLLNDLLHHTKYHSDTTATFSTLSASLQPYLVELLGFAAEYDREKNPKHHRRLDELLEIWETNGYYASEYVGKLKEVVRTAVTGPVAVEEQPVNRYPPREAPFVMPSTHGDTSTPYYDLPAGNLVPHIIPNSTVSLRPESIKPLQFLAGPADAKLVDAVKVFLHDVDQIYGQGKPEQKEDEVIDIDELGQTVSRDAISGEIVDGDTYYGWSRAFCQQMKKNRDLSSRSRSRSRSRSLAGRRRRYSDSLSDDSWRSRSRSRSRGFNRRDSYSRSRSRSPRRISRERSYSPPAPAPAPPRFPNQTQTPNIPPPAPPLHFRGPYPPGMSPPGSWAPPPPPPNMPMNYPHQPPPPPPPFQSYFPQPHMGQQQMPPGTPHFPPPHSGWGYGRGWQ